MLTARKKIPDADGRPGPGSGMALSPKMAGTAARASDRRVGAGDRRAVRFMAPDTETISGSQASQQRPPSCRRHPFGVTGRPGARAAACKHASIPRGSIPLRAGAFPGLPRQAITGAGITIR